MDRAIEDVLKDDLIFTDSQNQKDNEAKIESVS